LFLTEVRDVPVISVCMGIVALFIGSKSGARPRQVCILVTPHAGQNRQGLSGILSTATHHGSGPVPRYTLRASGVLPLL
jgi:hypothetical protein